MNVTAMGRSVPQFFRPDVIITKKRVAEEVVAGRKAVKYEALVKVPGIERSMTASSGRRLTCRGTR
jgi:hypothetical protein